VVEHLAPIARRVRDASLNGRARRRRAGADLGATAHGRPSPKAWLEAFSLGALNWLENCGCLVRASGRARGDPWHGVLVAYALAQVTASIPITPGGLGVVEGSLTAVLVAYGMAPTSPWPACSSTGR